MQCCHTHWSALRLAISTRGLDHLVAKSGEAATESMVRQIEGRNGKSDFDPLMNANWAIMTAFLRDVGLAAMEGDKCPLCEVEKSRPGLAENWINGAAEDQLHAARAGGLAPGLS